MRKMKNDEQWHSIFSKKYWDRFREKRSLKKHDQWLSSIREVLNNNNTNFAQKVNKIIDQRRKDKKVVYILCSPSNSANKGFWLYFDAKETSDLIISDAGECGLSSFTWNALSVLKNSDLNKTEQIIKETLSVGFPHITTEEAA